MSTEWASDNSDGLHAYVITKTQFGRSWHRVEYAASLKEAKRRFGWTRELYTTVSVRRASPDDVTRMSVLGGGV